MKQILDSIGDVISKEGMKPNPAKVSAIKEFPRPESKEYLQRFLGMIKYLGIFVQDLSQKSNQMRQLLKNDVLFNWTENMDKEFENLK